MLNSSALYTMYQNIPTYFVSHYKVSHFSEQEHSKNML